MKILTLAAIALSTVALTGCFTPQSFTRDASPAVALNTFDKVPGTWSYTIDGSLKDAKRSSFKPNGHVCSLHTYTLSAGDELFSATRRMLEDVTGGSQSGANDSINVRLESFSPRFSCAMGAVEGSCTGSSEVALTFSVVKDGKRSNFTVTSERSADAPAGQMCANALDAPAEATRKAIKDVLERASERLTTISSR